MNNKKHKCYVCNYSTDKLYNYKKHCNTDKHIKQEQKMGPIDDGFICEYCDNFFKHKNNRARHHRSCKKRDVKIIENKLREQIEIYRKQIKEDMKKVLDKVDKDSATIINKNNIVQNVNNNAINMYYVINNYKDAINFEDLMSKPLTQKEIKYIDENGSVLGFTKLIEDRCINNLPLEQRPIHCLDITRNKFLLKSGNKWTVDNKCNLMFNILGSKVREKYFGHKPDIDNESNDSISSGNEYKNLRQNVFKDDVNLNELSRKDLEEYLNNAKEIIKLHENKKQIVTSLANRTFIKDTVKSESMKKKDNNIDGISQDLNNTIDESVNKLVDNI